MTKNKALLLGIFPILFVGVLWADVSIQRVTGLSSGNNKIVFSWTADSSTALVASATSEQIIGWIYAVSAIPGNASAPTNLYDVTMTLSAKTERQEITGGLLTDLSSQEGRLVVPPSPASVTAPVFVDDTLTLFVINNSVNAATGIVTVYYSTTNP